MGRAHRAVFLDRAGVLNETPPAQDYVRSVDALRLLPGVPCAVAELVKDGYVPIVVSNQRGVARGLVSWNTLRAIERLIQAQLERHGVRIADFYYCPHPI